MIPRDVRYTVTSLPMQAGNVPAGAPAPAPSPVAALENVPSTMTAGVQAAAQVRNTGTVAAPWSISAGSGLTITPSSGTLAPGATQALALDATAGSYTLTLSVTGGSATGSPAYITASVASPPPAPAQSITLTALAGQSTSVGNSLGFSVQVANPVALPLNFALETVSGPTVTPSPSSSTWSLGDLNKAISAVWAAAGTSVIRARDANNAVSNSISVTVAAAPAQATLATLTLPSTGTTGSPTTGYVSLNGTAPAAGSITLAGGTGATIVPSTLSWTLGEAGTAKSFTVSYAADGAHSVSISSGIAGVTVAGSPASHTTNAAPSSADWLTRSTGPSVVWAHNFDADAEVSAHLADTGLLVGIQARRVVDETGIGCLEQIALGATLAAPYTAGGATMVIDDATYWPDPAVTGPFSFMVSTPAPTVGSKNLFTCTARSGTTLTVSYVDMSGA